jgi:hypothetical protein
MLSEIQIVSGTDGTPWTRKERECVLEVRSEHKLDDPTSFSILMHDLPSRDGNDDHRKLAEGTKVAVLARFDTSGDWVVLFQGKVTELETHQTQGGIGSTVLYRGVDIRSIMAGRSFTGAWTGNVDEVMKYIIELDFPDHDVHAPDNNTLEETRNPLAQNSNNLEFLRTQALAFGHNFWVSYAKVPDGGAGFNLPNPLATPAPVEITPTIHWARSPYLEVKLGNTSLPSTADLTLPILSDAQDGPVMFKVHMNANTCTNVTAFEDVNNSTQTTAPPSEQSAIQVPLDIPTPGGAPDADDPVVYFQPPAARQTEEDEQVNAALEIVRSFNKQVKLSTTKRLIEQLCLPHDMAGLEGVDDTLSGILFRVKEATHVIRIDNHYMDLILDSEGTVPLDNSTASITDALGAIA